MLFRSAITTPRRRNPTIASTILKPDSCALRGAIPGRERARVDVFDSFKRILSILACVNRNKCRDLHQSFGIESNWLANGGPVEISRQWVTRWFFVSRFWPGGTVAEPCIRVCGCRQRPVLPHASLIVWGESPFARKLRRLRGACRLARRTPDSSVTRGQ